MEGLESRLFCSFTKVMRLRITINAVNTTGTGSVRVSKSIPLKFQSKIVTAHRFQYFQGDADFDDSSSLATPEQVVAEE